MAAAENQRHPSEQTVSEAIAVHFDRSLAVMEEVTRSETFRASVARASTMVIGCLQAGGKVLFAGNGGSAADAQHIAAEFVSRLNFDRGAMAGLALTTDSSVITAIGNDYGFDRVFERQVRGLGRPGDILVAISTSGRSPNILRGLEAAREGRLGTVGFTGALPHAMIALCDCAVVVPCASTALIQQIHIAAAHAICGVVEHAIFRS